MNSIIKPIEVQQKLEKQYLQEQKSNFGLNFVNVKFK